MAMDGFTVCALAREFQEILAGGRIAKITQTEDDELYITVKPASDRGPVRLVLSASAAIPQAYLTESNKKGPMQAPAFCMLLRKHLGGGRIQSVEQPDFERIIRFTVEGLNEMGDRCTHVLLIELMGKYSNIILIDDHDRILDGIRRVSASMSSVREVLPGRTYFVPEQEGKNNPLNADRQLLQTAVRGKGNALYKVIYGSFKGFSPILAQELCERAKIDADKSAIALSDPEFDRLCVAFDGMIKDIQSGSITPTRISLDGIPKEYAAFPLTLFSSTPGAESEICPSMSALVEHFYMEKAETERFRQRSIDVRKITTQALERNRKKLDLQEKQLSDTGKRDKYRIYGELLQTYGYQAESHARSITVEDYHTGKELTIPLDPTLSAQENAKKYFDRYQKMKRTAEALEAQTAHTREEIEQLENLEESMRFIRTEEDLQDLRRELSQLGYVRRTSTGDRSQKKPKKSRPLHYRTKDDFGGAGPFDLYVGKNNFQNDELTFHFAQGGDWWFHAKKLPGSHVILRVSGMQEDEIPDHVFEIAAALAAHYSSAADQSLAEVDYVRKKEVKKPAGGRPGFVVYYTNYSMNVRPGIEELIPVDDE